MTDNKKMFYKLYKQTIKNNKEGYTTNIEEMCKLHIKGITEEEIQQYKNEVETIIKKCDGTNWTLGTELEYGGYDNRLSYDGNDEENIIETIKHDCSVSGDGTEYNLKPVTEEEFNSPEYKKKLESFCFRAVNKDCRIVKSAGEHFHYKWDEAEPIMGHMLKGILFQQQAITRLVDKEEDITDLEKILGAEYIKEFSYNEIAINTKMLAEYSYSENKRLKTKREDLEVHNKSSLTYEENEYAKEFTRMTHEARQWLYCTSNRSGTENYGLGTDATRGWDRHETIEIRCWRTTTDFRSIIARGLVGKFFLSWILKNTMLAITGYLTPEEESIWNDMDDKTRKCFTYLAFHTNNSHGVALKVSDICMKLGVTEAFARAIKCRTSIYQKSLLKGSDDRKAKDLINEMGE